MIIFEDVQDALMRRLARHQIRVYPSTGRFPCEASLHLADEPEWVSPGHPYIFVVGAATPARAVTRVLELLEIWLNDPLDEELGDSKTDMFEVRVGRRQGPAGR